MKSSIKNTFLHAKTKNLEKKSGTCTNGKHDILQILKVVYIATVEHCNIMWRFLTKNPKTNIWSMYITLTVKEKT